MSGLRLFMSKSTETGTTVEERKMSRPDSRWKAELLNLYRSAESARSEATDQRETEYRTGVMRACCAIWHRVTGKELMAGEG